MIDLFCYAIIENTVIDLTPMCQESAEVRVEPKPIVLEAFNLDRQGFFSGRVRNNTLDPISGLELHFESYDKDGKFLESGTFHSDLEILEPGQTSGFKWFAVDDATDVRIVDYTWD